MLDKRRRKPSAFNGARWVRQIRSIQYRGEHTPASAKARSSNEARTTRCDHRLRSAHTPSIADSPLPLPLLRSSPVPHPGLRDISMDSPVLTQLFRQLFRHPACQSLKSSSPPFRHDCVRLSGASHQQCRPFLTRRTLAKRKGADNGQLWTKRGDYPKDTLMEELETYPMVTAKDLRHRRERPKQVKMWTREFIDGKDDSSTSADVTSI